MYCIVTLSTTCQVPFSLITLQRRQTSLQPELNPQQAISLDNLSERTMCIWMLGVNCSFKPPSRPVVPAGGVILVQVVAASRVCGEMLSSSFSPAADHQELLALCPRTCLTQLLSLCLSVHRLSACRLLDGYRSAKRLPDRDVHVPSVATATCT